MTKKPTDAFERLSASARRVWLAGLGAIAEAEHRGDEIFDSLVDRGESYEKTLKEPMDKAKSRASSALHDLEGLVDQKVAAAMKTMGLASRAEVESLRREVERLKKAAAGRPGAKRASKKKKS